MGGKQGQAVLERGIPRTLVLLRFRFETGNIESTQPRE